ncbi:hypothetical protein GCM10027577_53190 [Spirosoma fluminis]
MPADAQDELFPFDWLSTEPVRMLINAAPTGVALLQAVRNVTGQIADFQYRLVNPMQQALTSYPEQDLMRQPLTVLSPDVVETGVLAELIEVVYSGQPGLWIKAYRLDGEVRKYDQLALKSGDGVLLLMQDITYRPLSASEHRQQADLLEAIQRKESTRSLRARLIALISGKT